MTQACIVTIGDEILIGQVVDTNSAHLATALEGAGVHVVRMLSVGDKPEEITSVLQDALSRYAIVITTGGLGPTKDDITKAVLGRLSGSKGLVEHPGQLEMVRSILSSRGLDVLPSNLAQAQVPDTAEVIVNRLGTAPIMVFRGVQGGGTLYALPGVPHEAVGAIPAVIRDISVHQSLAPIAHRCIMVFGVAESALSERIAEWEDALPADMHLAYLPNPLTGIRLRLSVYGGDSQDVEKRMEEQLEMWGEQIEAMMSEFPILRDICKGLKRRQYPAAVFVAGGLMMTLMTRCTYRFYHRPEELRRLNNSTLIIGDPACGKSFATRLYKLLAGPMIAADQVGKDAINAYRELMRTRGANKEKPKKPKVVIRVHPARTSNAQFIQDMVNAVEEVDGEPMHLHMLTFDTELDNTLAVQKGGSWIDKQTLELKAFHNEEDGQAYSNNDSVMQDFNVFWNYIYTGTPIALKKKVNEQNFGSGLATRLTVIPLPPTKYEMMDREKVVDYESDNRLKAWAEKLDKTKGELSLEKIVDELYDWTARRMMDARDNDSRADEMLLKRCAYHGLNFSAPFIVMRHWEKMHQEGNYWCGEFETDEADWRLAEMLVNIQFLCQRHYFGAMADAYFDNKLKDASVNVQRQHKTFDAFDRLPEEFTIADVMRCFHLSSEASARSKTSRLQRDHLIEKVNDKRGKDVKGTLFCKTNTIML